jgi:amidophosphoribosyltransferase
MCGVIGIIDSQDDVAQRLYDGLMGLQHRGQDAAGITTAELKGKQMVFHSHKDFGMVRDVFRTRNMRELLGRVGIGHCRYPTAGSVNNIHEAQPFYVNSPYGITLAHNGNLTNSEALKAELSQRHGRHINTNSDSEVLLNVLAHALQKQTGPTTPLSDQQIFNAVREVNKQVEGAYAVVSLIAGYGLICFRDPFGIRPLCIGHNKASNAYVVCSESAVLELLGFEFVRDVLPGETIIISPEGKFSSAICADKTSLNPCLFEFVYLARPDSVIDGVSVYDARVRMGAALVQSVKDSGWADDIDVVIPIPDSSRHSALELALQLGKPYREGFVKNRYIGRTFIMPGQQVRKISARQTQPRSARV